MGDRGRLNGADMDGFSIHMGDISHPDGWSPSFATFFSKMLPFGAVLKEDGENHCGFPIHKHLNTVEK